MCYHISQRKIDLERISDNWQAEIQFAKEDLPHYYHLNGFSREKVMIITQDEPESIQLSTWSLLPPNFTGDQKEFWTKQRGGELNNRDWRFFHEDPNQNYPEWKNEACLYHKCLVLVDGIYEPHYPKGIKDSIYFMMQRPGEEMFALLGIYTAQGNDSFTCSVITTAADTQFERVHNKAKRMPIFLEPESSGYYLNRDTEASMLELFGGYTGDSNAGRNMKLDDWPVSRDIKKRVDSNHPGIIKRVEYPELQKPKDLFS